MKKLSFSFDIGHASIGWAVLDITQNQMPEIKGCGTVLFPTDDCLASTRRQLRRQRRHIRSTRMRIARMKRLLAQLGVLTPAQLDEPGGPWPWKLAARVHAGGAFLSWRELWDVLRWYAHNRGYDGNRKWSRDEEEETDDTEKVKNARFLLDKFGKATMCETICAKLKIDPRSDDKKTSPIAYKTSNAAFPRDVVRDEVLALLQIHVGKLPKVDAAFITALCAEDNTPKDGKTARDVLKELGFDAHLPGRYVGGLLFGQAVPRFDNRIIGECPVSGEKRPLKDCREYLEFRWAEILANITVRRTKDGERQSLTAEERAKLTAIARTEGGFTAGEFKKAVLEVSGAAASNVELMMTHPDAADALVLDPALRLTKSNGMLKAMWIHPDTDQDEDTLALKSLKALLRRIRGRWNKGRKVTWEWILAQDEAVDAGLELKLKEAWNKTKQKPRKGQSEEKWEDRLKQRIAPEYPSGRAPYGREVMKRVVEQVMEAKMHPRENGGVLDAEIIKKHDLGKEIDELTNNHLVRHRLKILLRLVDDMVKTYADGDPTQVDKCVIEVARDLVEFSGKTNQDISKELGIKLKNFKDVSKRLTSDLEGTSIPINAGLIRKARIADDLGWTCPYTGKEYDAVTLARGKVDKDHIIPRSKRPSDSLDSLVITFSEVNNMKKDRTARQFIEDHQGQKVDGRPDLTIVTLKQYEAFVNKLAGEKKPSRFTPGQGSLDDKLRQWSRKQKMLLKDYEEKEFTPRDLTVTSHLVRMSARQLEKRFVHLQNTDRIVSLPGSVTGVVRKAWDCLGCLAPACPEVMAMLPTVNEKREYVMDADGKPSLSLQVRPKGEIRDITHLHHALDACVIAFASHFLPKDGKLWEQIVTKKVLKQDEEAFRERYGWHGLLKLAEPKDERDKARAKKLEVLDLPDMFKKQIVEALKERRVVQHVPADMSGARLEMNTWRVLSVDGDQVTLRQRTFGPKDIDPETGARKRTTKPAKERASKLVGLKDGKLSALKGALVIGENYGVALDPEPTMIAFHQVKKQLEELRVKNGGKPPRVLRNGMLIRVPSGDFAGVWRVRSCKLDTSKGLLLDVTLADSVPPQASRVDWCKRDVRLKTLLKANMAIIESVYCGVASEA
jgi:CRISPR-associated endonuclease Csn1